MDDNKGAIIQGRKAVLEALDAGRHLDKILIKDGDTEGSIRAVFAKAREMGIKIERVSKKQLDTLAEAHQGVVALAPAVDYATIADILANAKEKQQDPFIIILNNIKDPHNFGAIIRSAEGAGAHGIIIPARRAVGITATVEKTSAGAINYIPIAKVANIAQTIDKLKKQNVWIIGADARGKHYFNVDFRVPLALCIGAEEEGLGQLITKKCDFIAKIPMYGRIPSHNASVAAALVMYEVVKQRMA
ncbi:MAG: 23S rRNA (guanosine(2251)-2'-O)-methyltransferase RlmB [Defluviitaleaceae bacterium]|nr:23S rRNA (guanosine(2251)-2'-O)-methyltransferase RlmB [Defluviitaleaceae bacterium]